MIQRVDRVLTTLRFDRSYKLLSRKHKTRVIDKLIVVINKLINNEDVSQYGPHPINTRKGSTIYELHVDPDVLLLYVTEGEIAQFDLILQGLTDHDKLQREINKPRNISTVTNVTDITTAEDVLKASSESYERMHNTMSGNIPEYVKELLDDISENTDIVTQEDIEKFDKKLAQSDKFKRYSISTISHFEDKWYDAYMFEDSDEMNRIAHIVRECMTYPIQKTVTKSTITKDDLNNAAYSDSFMNDRACITIDGNDYVKIGEDEWQHMPSNSHALGGIYNTDKIYQMLLKTSQPVKFYK